MVSRTLYGTVLDKWGQSAAYDITALSNNTPWHSTALPYRVEATYPTVKHDAMRQDPGLTGVKSALLLPYHYYPVKMPSPERKVDSDQPTNSEALDSRHAEYYFAFVIFLASNIYDNEIDYPLTIQASGRERVIQSPTSQLCHRIRSLLRYVSAPSTHRRHPT
jgi:hypothetical protein